MRIFLALLLGFVFSQACFAETSENVIPRGEYGNSRHVFESTGHGRVAFLGGSITEMDGYRPMVCDYLRRTFPKTEFEFVAAGISSTCSDTGAFRLESDVLSKGPIDLFFVEFAVNDNQDGFFSLEHSIRGFEGIIRHIRTVCPNVDVVVTFFANEPLMDVYRKGEVPVSIQAHSLVAERYELSTVNMAREIQQRIDSRVLTWAEYGGVHPAPRGNQICADLIASLLDAAWKTPVSAVKPHALPEPIDRFSYANGSFRGFEGLNPGDFTCSVPDWKSIPGGFRDRFAGRKLLCASTPGASCTFEFSGSALGLYVLAGPDAGEVEYSVDGQPFRMAQLYHAYSSGLHYPRTVVLADELSSGEHTATIRVSANKSPQSKGTAIRILEICQNSKPKSND